MSKSSSSSIQSYEEQAEILKGLGLGQLSLDENELARMHRRHCDRYERARWLMRELSCRVSRQTPISRIMLCDRNGQFETLYDACARNNAEQHLFLTTVPVEAKFIERLWALEQSDTEQPKKKRTLEEKLYRLMRLHRVPLIADPFRYADNEKLTCDHLVVMDRREKASYFVGSRKQTELVEYTLAPFVNFGRRARTKSQVTLANDNAELLDERRGRLIDLFADRAAGLHTVLSPTTQ
jgi:hypothetical protein